MKLKISNIVLSVVALASIWINNHFENLSRATSAAYYNDDYILGAPFIMLGLLACSLIVVTNVISLVASNRSV